MLNLYADMYPYELENGQSLRLGKKLGEGGEGVVYTLPGYPHLVAKIYSNPIDAAQVEKLRTICAMASPQLDSACAWPRSLIVCHDRVCGFTMPLLSGGTEIHELFGSASRKRLFPKADWGFLIHVSKNLAAAVNTLHRSNIVVGDLNQRNTVVFPDGTVKLWDCDSFQIQRNNKIYYCKVGVPEFTPPELQDCQTFDGVKRTFDHDLFSLAVMIFYLLFMGRHPYSGDPIHSSTMSYELQDAIRRKLFAYSSHARRLGIAPPKNSPPVFDLGEQLLPLFSKSFETLMRTSAGHWFDSLSSLSNNLNRCDINPGHVYPRTRNKCPWCAYETAWKVVTFLPTASPPQFIRTFNFEDFVNNVQHRLFDLPISVPPPDLSQGNAIGQPFPTLIPISDKLRDDLKHANSDLEALNKSYHKQLQSWNADPRIAESQRQGQALQESINAKEQLVAKLEQRIDALDHKRHSSHTIVETYRALSSTHTLRRSMLILVACSPLLFFVGYPAGMLALAVSLLIAAAFAAKPLYYKTRSFVLNYQYNALSSAIQSIEETCKLTTDQYWQEELQLKILWEDFKKLVAADEERKAEQLKALSSTKEAIESQLIEVNRLKDEMKVAQKAYDASRLRRNVVYEIRKMRYQDLLKQEKSIAMDLFNLRRDFSNTNAKRNFLAAQQSYLDTQKKLKRQIEDYKKQVKEHQLNQYLSQFEIEKARITGIGSSLVITLRSHGIETAADINRQDLLKIIDFGDNRFSTLELWRDQHARSFKWNVQQVIQPSELEAVKQMLGPEFNLCELAIRTAAKEVETEYDQAYTIATNKMQRLSSVREQLKQAFADIQVPI